MYIKYKGLSYPCECRPSTTMVYRGLPEDFPAPVDSKISLCSNDGFVMREDNPADYSRQTFVEGVLTLTNTPEPAEPIEYPPTTDEVLNTLLGVSNYE